MREFLPFLIWTVVVTLVLALVGWLALKWIAVRIARRVADLAERHLAVTIERGLAGTGVRMPRVEEAARRAVPVAGDLFDASYHADEKSAALIREFVEKHTAP